MTVIGDRNQIHSKSKVVKGWLAGHPGVVAEDFPGYVPDLKPDEGGWGRTKYGRLAKLAAGARDELWDWVIEELIPLKHRPDLLRGFIRQTELPGLSLAASLGTFTKLEPVEGPSGSAPRSASHVESAKSE